MGIYGALSTAVTGLRAQSFALENISGNIANSQTTGFKRIDTDFLDMIPDAPTKRQTAGSVLAQSSSTNTIQGDITTSSTETYMAINGSGFFVVEPKIAQADGSTVFAGSNYYTRRGDFELDSEGYLVNGSGYYLKGLPIDATTGNVSGSVPSVIQLSNTFLPASATTRVDYTLNLPQLPQTSSYVEGVRGSELFVPSDFDTSIAADTTATATGSVAPALIGTNAASTAFADGDSLTVTIDGTAVTFDFHNGGTYSGTNIPIDISGAATINSVLSEMQIQLREEGGTYADTATVGLNGGNIKLTLGDNVYDSMDIAYTTTHATGLGLTSATYTPTRPSLTARVDTISGAMSDEFISQSVAGGAITVYAENGAPVSVQLRWAKIDSAETGGTDNWNLFYMSDSTATGSTTMWTRVDQDFAFGSDGSLSPVILSTELTALDINGTSIGNVTLEYGANGVTQFADTNGTASVTTLDQNGYAAGEFVSVSVNDSGRVVATYDNGQTLEIAQVVVANFNAANQLKRMDGGIFAATAESGEGILSTDGSIIGAALESSNTDISEEFTKLIVTQQAYAAGTRIVSTADEMLQEALNMVR